jgi:hypothetical protein
MIGHDQAPRKAALLIGPTKDRRGGITTLWRRHRTIVGVVLEGDLAFSRPWESDAVMQAFRLTLAVATTVVAVVVGVSACAVALDGVAEQGWLFPGDPPCFDLALWPAAFGLAAALVGTLLFRRQLPASRLGGAARVPYFMAVAATCVAAAACLICVLAIGYRHLGAWREIRVAVATYGDAIAADVGDRRLVLSEQQFLTMRAKHLPHPVPATLPGWGTVHLRMAHGVYPYVGVDFDGAKHALFDPATMICTYSD